MKTQKILTAVASLLMATGISVADPANHGKVLPGLKPGFDAGNIYLGAEGLFSFPVGFTGDQNIAGVGFGGAIEAGYDWDGWLLGTHIEFRKSLENGNLMQSLNNVFITAEASKIIGHDLIPALPSFLDLRPTLGFGLNILNATYYPNNSYKAIDKTVSGTSVANVINAGIEVEFPGFLVADSLIPYVGFDMDFSTDKSGEFVYSGINIGLRTVLGNYIGYNNETPFVKFKPKSKVFTPDGDGDADEMIFKTKVKYDKGAEGKSWKLKITTDVGGKERTLKTFKGIGVPPAKIVWKGEGDDGVSRIMSATDYKAIFTVEDSKGNVTTKEEDISSGILVKEDGKFYKIQVPSIEFDANKATFDTLDQKTKNRNEMILNMVAKSLKKYGKYKVIVQGHANNVTGTEEEEVNELIPLSSERAEVIKDILIQKGVKKENLTSEGKGGREPIASGDQSWRNRRVEFVLIKPVTIPGIK